MDDGIHLQPELEGRHVGDFLLAGFEEEFARLKKEARVLPFERGYAVQFRAPGLDPVITTVGPEAPGHAAYIAANPDAATFEPRPADTFTFDV